MPGLMARAPAGRAKPATLKDLAAHLGISFSTVSRALRSDHHVSTELRARVLAAADELGYIPNSGARLLHGNLSTVVGLVIPDFQNQLFAAAAHIISERCHKAGYEMILAVSGADPEIELKQVIALRAARAAGIVIAASGRSAPRTIELLSGGAVVQLSGRELALPFPTVATNDKGSLDSSTRHLIQLGHRRIGYVGGPVGLGTADERYSGYELAMADARLQLDPRLVFRGPLHIDFARLAMTRLLQMSKRPTAVVMSNSLQTEGAIEAARDAGVEIPRDLSLMGYGDPSWFKLWGPGITTIDAREVELADTVAAVLMEQIQNLKNKKPIETSLRLVINTRLILRGSTAPPR